MIVLAATLMVILQAIQEFGSTLPEPDDVLLQEDARIPSSQYTLVGVIHPRFSVWLVPFMVAIENVFSSTLLLVQRITFLSTVPMVTHQSTYQYLKLRKCATTYV